MHDIYDFLFDATRFVQRGSCGRWHPAMEWLYVWSNLLISAAYLVIPAVLYRVKSQFESLIGDKRARMWTILFIGSCGIGHLENAIAFQWPSYHLFACWHSITAFISWKTIFILLEPRE